MVKHSIENNRRNRKMAVDNQFKETVDALFKGMNGVVSSKTVVGDAIHIGIRSFFRLLMYLLQSEQGHFMRTKRTEEPADSAER